MQQKKRALGRGLEALLPQKPPPQEASSNTEANTTPVPALAAGPGRLPISQIRRNESQPRQSFDPTALSELADSIRKHGIIQPVAVVASEKGTYTLVAGERRWRAAKEAGLKEIPAIVLDPLSDQEVLECALVENLQRENLSPLEEAKAYRALIDTFGVSQETVAERVGKSRPAIANALRLLKLPSEFQKDLEEGRLTAGHARALLALDNLRDQQRLRDAIVQEQLSVRQAEELAGRILGNPESSSSKNKARQGKTSRPSDPDTERLREQLIEALACRVDLKPYDAQRGKIEIQYDSLDELERILTRMGVGA